MALQSAQGADLNAALTHNDRTSAQTKRKNVKSTTRLPDNVTLNLHLAQKQGTTRFCGILQMFTHGLIAWTH
jgi:hypothetical protein